MNKVKSGNKGYTLLELLVALSIGAGITMTGLSFYAKSTSLHSDVDVELAFQENAYFFDQIVRQLVNQAGYRPLNYAELGDPFLPVHDRKNTFLLSENVWKQSEFIRSVENGIALRFAGASNVSGVADGSIVNCIGEQLSASDIGEIQLTVNSGILTCSSKTQSVGILGFPDTVTIDAINWKVGVDTTADGSIEQFVPLGDSLVTPETSKAIRAHLLLISVSPLLENDESYVFDGTEYVSTDKKIRKETITTVKLKN